MILKGLITPELTLSIIAITLTVIGMIYKRLQDVNEEIKKEAAFRQETVDSIQELEKRFSEMQDFVDDLNGYLLSNSDWHIRKSQRK